MKAQRKRDNIFKTTNCPDATVLLSYTNGALQEDVAWNIEKHITDCPLCADALEGMFLVSGVEVLDEIHTQNNYANNFDFKKHKNRELKIILTASIMAIASLVILYFNKHDADKSIAHTKETTNNNVNTITEKPATVQTNGNKEIPVQPPVNTRPSTSINITETFTDTIPTLSTVASVTDSSMMVATETPPVFAEEKKEKINAVFSVSGLQVIYIHELKAIDYASIYDELNNSKAVLLKSLDAKYPNAESMQAAKENQPSVDTIVYSKILNDALLAYHDEKYLNAQHAFEKILSVYPDDQNALCYGGLCLYHSGKPGLAIQQLEKILDHRQSPFREEAEWNIALSYHKNNQYILCKQWLKKIIAAKGFYETKAKEFLKELK